jgi:RNA polymerase sigma-70 factor, ECF subfamily
MMSSMGEDAASAKHEAVPFLALYDSALPQVFGYLVRRCGSATVAEDLTSETFIAAIDAVDRGKMPSLTVAWLIGIARHKLVDHWRRVEREQRLVSVVSTIDAVVDDDWQTPLDATLAHQVLASLAPQHRSALVLRHLDGLPVAEVARLLGRTVGATEVLLVRARRAFRETYESCQKRGEDQ